jgi:hypothetical protein
MPVIPEAGRLRQENIEFKASLGYRARVYLKNQKLKTKTKKGITMHTNRTHDQEIN